MYTPVSCNKCNWISFQKSRADCMSEIASFNEYYETLSPEMQQEYYGGEGSSIKRYESCFRCGNSYKDFRDTTPEEEKKIYGSTVNPIMDRRD